MPQDQAPRRVRRDTGETDRIGFHDDATRSPQAWFTGRLTLILIGALVLAGTLAYSVIAHRLTVGGDRTWVGYVFAFGSVLCLLLALSWTSPHRWSLLGAIALLSALAWHYHQYVDVDPRWMYLLQHAGMQALLGILFGRTLLPGRTPLITTFALLAHKDMPPEMIVYTRSVNWAWTLYFATMTVLSLGLWFLAPPSWWSVMANFLTMPATAAMFIVEYMIRLRRFPDFQHVSVLEGIRAFSRKR